MINSPLEWADAVELRLELLLVVLVVVLNAGGTILVFDGGGAAIGVTFVGLNAAGYKFILHSIYYQYIHSLIIV